MAKIWYKVKGVEYCDTLGLSELDPMAPMWDNVTRIEHENEVYRTKSEVTAFLNDYACFTDS
ncbi:MAG: hypothetical protein N4A71_02470 [Carboxylicivirga sp.]|nr:hypothetical protein [Carboxylicivirga sp.]